MAAAPNDAPRAAAPEELDVIESSDSEEPFEAVVALAVEEDPACDMPELPPELDPSLNLNFESIQLESELLIMAVGDEQTWFPLPSLSASV